MITTECMIMTEDMITDMTIDMIDMIMTDIIVILTVTDTAIAKTQFGGCSGRCFSCNMIATCVP